MLSLRMSGPWGSYVRREDPQSVGSSQPSWKEERGICNDQGVGRMVSAELGEIEAVKRRVRGRHRGMRCLIFCEVDVNVYGFE